MVSSRSRKNEAEKSPRTRVVDSTENRVFEGHDLSTHILVPDPP